MTSQWQCAGAVAALVGATWVATAAAAAPGMSSAWLSIDVSQEQCVQKGTATIRRNGFGSRFEVLANAAIYGERGDYTAMVRCVAEKGIVYFVVAGPDSPASGDHMMALRNGF